MNKIRNIILRGDRMKVERECKGGLPEGIEILLGLTISGLCLGVKFGL